MTYNFFRYIFLFAAAILMSIQSASAQRPTVSDDRSVDGYWKTERAKFLDAPSVTESLRKILLSPDESVRKSENPSDPETLARDISKLMIEELINEKGLHLETALAAIGASAGFSCQMAIREGLIRTGKIELEKAFVVVETKSGENFYMGGLLNECIVSGKQGQNSVWGYVGGAVQSLEKPLPDIVEIFERTSATVGGDDFGKFDVPDQNQPHNSSEELLWKYWNIVRNFLIFHGQEPMVWPFILGISAQQLITFGDDIIDPTLAGKIVMEAAIPMSKIDPIRVHQASLLD